MYEAVVGLLLASVFCLLLGLLGIYLNKRKSPDELLSLKDPAFMKEPHGLGGGTVIAAIRYPTGLLLVATLFGLCALILVVYSELT